MEDPKVKIGDREFVVPEYSLRQQRVISPMLKEVSEVAGEVGGFPKMIDAIYECLTVKGKDGTPINDISKDDFDDLKCGYPHVLAEVLPVLMKQAGFNLDGPADSKGGAGDAAPRTPLSGETTSTT